MKTVRIWDLPIRLFHWVLTVLIVAAVVTQKIGGNATEWHFRIGYAILALLLFRLLWGFAGTRYARFSSFMHGPSTIVGYIRGGKEGLKSRYLGHNPLGGLSVFAMLGVISAQAIGGLFANDDIASEGPLVKFISKELSDKITWLHKEVGANVIYILVAMHVIAIAYYYFKKRQNLLKPMITGDQEVNFDAPPAEDTASKRLLALGLLVLCAAAIYFLIVR
jgi:cytochrome b